MRTTTTTDDGDDEDARGISSARFLLFVIFFSQSPRTSASYLSPCDNFTSPMIVAAKRARAIANPIMQTRETERAALKLLIRSRVRLALIPHYDSRYRLPCRTGYPARSQSPKIRVVSMKRKILLQKSTAFSVSLSRPGRSTRTSASLVLANPYNAI